MTYYFIDYENVMDAGLNGAELLKKKDRVVVFYSHQVKNLPFERHVALSESAAAFEYLRIEHIGKNYLDFQLSTYLGYLIAKKEPDQIVIVTKDNGYRSVVDFWNERGIAITMQEAILKKPEKRKKEAATQKKQEKRKKEPSAPKKQTSKRKAKTLPQKQESEKKSAPLPKALTPEKAAQPKASLEEAWRKKVRAAVRSDNLSPSRYVVLYEAFAESASTSELNNRLVKSFQNKQGGRIYNHVKKIFVQYQKERA